MDNDKRRTTVNVKYDLKIKTVCKSRILAFGIKSFVPTSSWKYFRFVSED